MSDQRLKFGRTHGDSYEVRLREDGTLLGEVVRHEAGYGVRVLWNSYLPGEIEALPTETWRTTRWEAAYDLLHEYDRARQVQGVLL